MARKHIIQMLTLWPQNIGLQAGILSQRTFTIFVVMALVRTNSIVHWAAGLTY